MGLPKLKLLNVFIPPVKSCKQRDLLGPILRDYNAHHELCYTSLGNGQTESVLTEQIDCWILCNVNEDDLNRISVECRTVRQT